MGKNVIAQNDDRKKKKIDRVYLRVFGRDFSNIYIYVAGHSGLFYLFIHLFKT
jgi:hypothetical protein